MVDEPQGTLRENALLLEELNDVVEPLDHMEYIHFFLEPFLAPFVVPLHFLAFLPTIASVETRDVNVQKKQHLFPRTQSDLVMVFYFLLELRSPQLFWNQFLIQVPQFRIFRLAISLL